MQQIIVIYIPPSNLYFQVVNIMEFVSLIKLLLVRAMASFNRAVLSRFAGIDEIVNNIVFRAEKIEWMKLSGR